jgi:Tfp pilus assembly protein PilV
MSKLSTPRKSIRYSQAGMVSIMTTMVLMIVISLIVLGFAQLSRRNQRETLDRQLSTQAFYAAESGVNDVRKRIRDALDSGTTVVPDKTGCTDTGVGGFYAALNPDIDAAKNVRYTCLLVDASPEILRFSDVGTTSVVVPVTSSSGAAISEIRLDWQSKVTGGNPTAGCPTSTNNVFSPTTNWNCGYGVLRFDLVPVGGNFNADDLRTRTMTTFAVPFSSGGTSVIPYVPDVANDNRRGVSCNASGCSLRINGLSQSNYYMRISSIYRNVGMQISATDAGGASLGLTGAQAVVDSTGKAQDVLRRIQVHVPIRASSQNQLSDYAIQSTDAICKRFSVMDGYFDSDVSGVTSTNRLCRP